MFPHISIVTPIKLVSWFSLVGTAMCLIACTLSGKDFIPCRVISTLRYSKLPLAKNNYSALILKPACLGGLQSCYY